MRDLIVTQNITVDGVIDGSGGWFFPAEGEEQSDQDEMLEILTRQRQAADAFLVGRVTFEEMRGYWPTLTDDTTGITAYLDDLQKYVVSSTLEDPKWANTTVLRGTLEEDIRRLKANPGNDIVTTGSITLVHALIPAGLVDEYRLFVYPTVLGRGRRLFTNAHIPQLRLEEVRSVGRDVSLLRYRTA
ncbi:MAG: dihydrofolate reductase family protein [Jiangellaceae bacterium]